MAVKQQKSLKLNFIMNAILTMSQFIFPLITFPYVSRILLPEGTGKVSFATSVISYFAMFAQLGIPTYGIRACAKVRDNKEKLTKTVLRPPPHPHPPPLCPEWELPFSSDFP